MKTQNRFSRRALIKFATAGTALAPMFKLRDALSATTGNKIVIMGGGFAGATAAKYLKLWGGTSVDVTLVEPKQFYYTPILSNEVLVGDMQLNSLRFTYTALQQRYGINHVQASVTAIDPSARSVTLSDGTTLNYDRLIVASGIDFKYVNAYDTSKIPVAWQGGPEVLALQSKLQAIPNGGTFLMTIPKAPYRCPPGPYERACLVADWLARNKPGAKVVVLDENPDTYLLWNGIFKNIFPSLSNLQRIGSVTVTAVDDANMSVTAQVNGQSQTFSGDVVNVLPRMRSGAFDVLSTAGLIPAGQDWAPVHGQTFESTLHAGVHIIGDAQAMQEVPKAGHVANAEAKVCANAVLRSLNGVSPYANPKLSSFCVSPVNNTQAIWISEMFALDPATGEFVLNGGLQNGLHVNQPPRTSNKRDMYNWAGNLFGDVFL